ncbi:MAG: carboxypeptidase regulatory-like domain-containing protein [Pirellulaceae bacterium]|nr:carboxypeptidase regulatory-like domain-containing protein [Pirellulaceae bacterium]
MKNWRLKSVLGKPLFGGLVSMGLSLNGSPKRRVADHPWLRTFEFQALEPRHLLAADFGDAPFPYPTLLDDDGARHTIVAGAPRLGVTISSSDDGQPSLNADADLGDDGVFLGNLTLGSWATVIVDVQGAAGYLDAWVDFNQDGSWNDPVDKIFSSRWLELGENILNFFIPADAFPGETFARFRISSTGNLPSTGLASDGEVEDYLVDVSSGINNYNPIGPEFLFSNPQMAFAPTSAVFDSSGNAIISQGNSIRRFSPSGVSIGGFTIIRETPVFETKIGIEEGYDILHAVYKRWNPSTNSTGLFYSRLNLFGATVGGEILVHAETDLDNINDHSIAVNPAGRAVVLWRSYEDDGLGGIGSSIAMVRGFNIGLNQFFTRAVSTSSYQLNPRLAINEFGDFAVGWTDPWHGEDANPQVFVKRFSKDGIDLGGGEQAIGNGLLGSIASNSYGALVVVYEKLAFPIDQDINNQIFALRIDRFGQIQGPEFRVHSLSGSDYRQNPMVATNSFGDFVVAWDSWMQDGSAKGVYARRFNADGTPLDAEFLVNTWTAGSQELSSLAFKGWDFDDLMFVWESEGMGSGGMYPVAQRFGYSPKVLLPDLVINEIIIPSSANLGQAISMEWVVRNSGEATASGAVRDRVYLSSDSILGNDILLFSKDYSLDLSPGVQVRRSENVTIPTDLEGQNWKIIVKTDVLDQIVERSEFNNFRVSGTTLLVSGPDLVVSLVSVPEVGESGEQIQVTWVISNQGGAVNNGNWSDRIYLSTDSQVGGDLVIGSFSFTGSLAAGESVQRTQLVTIPAGVYGTRWIVVQTDVNNQIAESNEDNNFRISDGPIEIVDAIAPNLQVASVTTPLTAFSGQAATVRWVVTNSGTAPTNVSTWFDGVYLSSNPVWDSGDLFLGQILNQAFLDIGESYSSEATFILPNGIQGNYYIIVVTDGTNRVIELNETDNAGTGSATNVQLTPPPDLRVTQIQPPTLAFSGQPTTITWTVTNSGIGDTRGAFWRDRVYLSSNQTLDDSDFILSTVTRQGALASGESYTRTVSLVLPVGISGDYFFIVRTDVFDEVFEHVFSANNTSAASNPTNVLLTPPPDLEVTQVSAPATARSGASISVNYRVANNGSSETPNFSWRDELWLSSSSVFDPDQAVLIGSRSHSGQLLAGSHYDAVLSGILPHGLTGPYHLFVRTDALNSVFELDTENNVKRTLNPVQLESRPADLVIPNVSAVSVVEAGGTLLVSWEVRNQGIGDTITTRWRDRVVLSRDGSVGNGQDIELGRVVRNGLLGVGQSYQVTNRLFEVPFGVEPGDYVLLVITDAENEVYEGTNENNNRSQPRPITVNRPTADLRVSNIVVGASVASGTRLTVTWTVGNFGLAATNAEWWHDDVYLSTDPFLSSDDLRIGSVIRSNRLLAGQEYTASRDLEIPIDLSGNFYVIVVTDSGNRVEEGAGESNNVLASSSAVTVTLSPVPDLAVVSVSAPTEAFSAQSMVISWTVQNVGMAEAFGRNWYDSVYLSLDQVFDRQSDIYLGFRTRRDPLAAGEQYTQQGSFFIPFGLTGQFYVFVVTDSGNVVHERGALANNVDSTLIPTQIVLAPPADLAVGTITIPDTAISGQNVSITYTVHNLGPNWVRGSWTDALFISADQTWGINDPLLGKINMVNANIAPGGSYTQTLTAPMPGVIPGTYHVIVRSDIRNQIREGNLVNNLAASIDQILVDFEELTLGVPTSGTLSAGQFVYYRVDVPAGEALSIFLDSAATNGFNELYVAHNRVPTRSDFDFASIKPFEVDQRVVVGNTIAGTYYILAYGNSTPVGQSNYSLTAELVQFSVFDTNYGRGGTAGNRTILINGVKFDRSVLASIADSDGLEFPAISYFRVNDTQLYATFDLTGVNSGHYDLTLLKPTTNETFTVSNSFEVIDGGGANVSVFVSAPSATVRPREGFPFVDRLQYNFTVGWNNGGLNDAPAPLLLLVSNDEFGSSMREIVGGNGTLSEYFIASGVFGPPGVLTTQDGGQRVLVTRNSGIAMGIDNADIFYTLTNVLRDENAPFDWEFFRDRLRPANDLRADFDEAFDRVIASIGPLNRHVQEMIARNVQIVSSVQSNATKFEDILYFEMLKSRASIYPSIRGTINASDFNVPLGDEVIYAINRSTDEIFSTTLFQDGSFFFVDLSLGNYEFYYPAAQLMPTEPQTISDEDTPLDIVLQATAGISVSGTVITSAQTPLSNASILLVPLSEVDAIKPIAGATGEGGKFLISHIMPGSYRVLVSANGYQTAVIDQIYFETGDSDELIISLDKVVNIIGTVRSELDGSPLSNAMLSVIDSISGDSIDFTFGEDDGSFVLSAPPGTYKITAERIGYSSGSILNYIVSEDSAADPLSIVLKSAPSISGILVDISGTPVGEATIELFTDDINEGLLLRTSTSQDGDYMFEHVAQGTYKIRAISGTALLVETDLTVDGTSDITANLSSEAVAKVQGIVRDGMGTPVVDARVSVYRNSKPILSTVVNENGKFELQFFVSGSYVIVAESDAGVFPARTLEVEPDGSTISIEFDTGIYQVSGTIKDQDGLALQSVPVFLVIDDDVNGYSREVQVTTDELGRFIFDGLISGSYSVSAGPSGLLAATEVVVNVESENVEGIQLTLSRAASFSATVRESNSDTPIANAMLFVYSVETNDLRGVVGTDDDGVTAIFALPIGVYDVIVVSEGRPAVTLKEFSLEHLGTDLFVSMDAVGTGKSVTGTVSSRIPELSENAVVYANDEFGRVIGVAFVQDDGAYQLMGLPNKELHILGTLEGSIVNSSTVDLRFSDSAIIDFTLNPVVSVSDSSFLSEEGSIFRFSAPAGWGDNWWRDARREIPEMNLDVSDEQLCDDEDQLAYDRAVRAVENAKTARELALARQEILYWQSWSAPPAIIGATSTIAGKILLGGLVIRGVKIPLGVLGTIIGVDFARLFLSINDASAGLNSAKSEYIRVAAGVDPAIARDSFLLGAQALETAQSARLAKEIEFADGILKLQQKWMDPDVARGERFNRAQKALIDRLNLRNSSAKALAMFAKVFAALDAFFSTKTEFERLGLLGEEIGTQWANLIADVNRYYKAFEEAERLIADFNNSKQTIGDQRRAVDDTSWSTRKNTSITVSPRGVLSNDIGVNCDELIVGSWSAVTGGTLSNTSELGGFTFTPSQDFVGTARFSYSLAYRDAEGRVVFVDNANVSIEVLDDDECEGDACGTTHHVGSWDPNDIVGPTGYGEENWIASDALLNYMVRFENDSDLANAPAQIVKITQTLDSDLDYRTFRLGNFAIGEHHFSIPEGRAFYSERLDFVDSHGVFVDIFAGIDISTGEAFWEMRSIDPATGDIPTNPLLGFLPPNQDGIEGQGFVSYTVRAKANVPTGTVIDAEARIIFDINEPIDTPPIFNTIDAGIPVSQIAFHSSPSDEATFVVRWDGEDDENGSGIHSFNIFVSTDDLPYVPWLMNTRLREAIFVGEFGRRYKFFASVRDNAGNREATPSEAELDVNIGSLVAQLENGSLIVEDRASVGVNNHLTISVVGSDLIIEDASERFGFAPNDATLSQNGRRMVIPVDLISTGVVIRAGAGNDTIIVKSFGLDLPEGLVVDGGLGNDIYQFWADFPIGHVTLLDAGGIDALDFSPTSLNVTLRLDSSGVQQVTPTMALRLESGNTFENATGGSGNDVLIGNALDNILIGNAGDDVLRGLGGNDALNGGIGNDRLIGGLGDDRYVFGATAPGGETNWIIEDPREGTDTISFASRSENVTLDLGTTSLQHVHSGRWLRLSSDQAIENAIGGSGDDVLMGNRLDNELRGNAGNDTLNGRLGNDRLIGGLGNDRYVFGGAFTSGYAQSLGKETKTIIEHENEGYDVISFAAVTQDVTINLGSTQLQQVHLGRALRLSSGVSIEEVIGGSGNDWLIGNSLDNVLRGNGGNDILNGGLGNDRLIGGEGDDRYVFGDAYVPGEINTIVEHENQGNDTISFAASTLNIRLNLGFAGLQQVNSERWLQLSSGLGVENALGGSGNDILLGNALNNRLVGNGGNDILVGFGGDDILLGGAGRDILIGGYGADRLDGGSGQDILISGFTIHDGNAANLRAIRDVWTSTDRYVDRVVNLKNGVGSSPVALRPGTDVRDDNRNPDRMIGDIGRDWFFAGLNDKIVDLFDDELVEQI